MNAPAAPARVAVDLLGSSDGAIAYALGVAATRPDLTLLLVGAPEQLGALVTDPEVRIVPATERISENDDPVRAVRSRRSASVRLAARLVRDGAADAFVSFGPPAATIAAAQFSLQRLPGLTKPSLATVVTSPHGAFVVLDTGAGPDATPDALVQYAISGVAYARARLGVQEPAVGLLSAGYPTGSGDPFHDDAHRLLSGAALSSAGPVRYAGMVDVNAVLTGGGADVVVTDGFTGKVLLAAISANPGGAVTTDRAGAVTGDMGGAVLLGMNGVVVIGGGPTSEAVAAGVLTAAEVVHSGLVGQLGAEMAALVARRRQAAGAELAL